MMEIAAIVIVATTFAIWARNKWREIKQIETEARTIARVDRRSQIRVVPSVYDQDRPA